MTRLAESLPGLAPYPVDAFTLSVQPSAGLDIAGLVNLRDAYHDTHEYYELPAGVAQPHWERQPFPTETGPDGQPTRTGNLFVTENSENTGTAIFLTDSFGQNIRDYLALHFGRMLHITDAHMEDITELIRREKPDVIFDLNVAREYPVALGEHAEMAAEVIEQQLEQSIPLVDLTPRTPTLIRKAEELDWATSPEGITLVSRGEDPRLYLSATHQDEGEPVSGGVVNLRCSITSPKETTFALYYLNGKDDEFSPERMAVQKLYPGQNNFVLRIYEPIRLDNIRVDPGAGTGTFQLHRLTIANSEDV